MSQWRKRLLLIIGSFVLFSLAMALTLWQFNSNITFFITPTELASQNTRVTSLENMRLGGVILNNSLKVNSVECCSAEFVVTDFQNNIKVHYNGDIIPSLLKEGQSVIALGHVQGDIFISTELLVKHDERYIPKEVVDALQKSKLRRG